MVVKSYRHYNYLLKLLFFMRKKLLSVFAICLSIIIGFGFASCSSTKKMSEQVAVVKNLDVKKYTGVWYEIARFDFKYQKDMDSVTANYSLKENGDIKVINKGYNTKDNEWKDVKGKAKFNGNEGSGALKVSFFGPFYSEYNIVKLSDDYSTALIFGESLDNMWILSRKKTISESVKKEYLDFAAKNGYDLSRLVWTKQ